VGRDVARIGLAKGEPLRRQGIEQELIGVVRPLDRHAAEPLLEGAGTGGMIDVAVGQQDLFGLEADAGNAVLDAREIAARIDHRPDLGVLLPQQGAILLEGRDGDDGGFQGHGLTGSRGTSRGSPAER